MKSPDAILELGLLGPLVCFRFVTKAKLYFPGYWIGLLSRKSQTFLCENIESFMYT